MRSRRFLRDCSLVFVMFVGWTIGLSGQTTDNLLPGAWKVNLVKSKFSPEGLGPKSLTTTFEVADDQIKAVIEGVDFQGRAIRSEYVARFDGKDYAWKGTVDGLPSLDQDTVAWRRVAPYTYEIINKSKGETLTTLTLVIARDGKTRTITARGEAINNKVFFEKQ